MTSPSDPIVYCSLVEMLRHRATSTPDTPAFVFLSYETGETPAEQPVTYGELDKMAMNMAGRLRGDNCAGKKALLLVQPGIAYIAAFFGALYADVVPVPAYPPLNTRFVSRLIAVIRDAGVDYALTEASMIPPLANQLGEGAPTLRIIDVDDIFSGPEEGSGPPYRGTTAEAKDLAFLQYTSGSTSTPKGVMVTHGNLLHNIHNATQSLRQLDSPVSGVSWLPPYHDMGLIGSILQTIYVGATTYLMSPLDFLWRPLRWLAAISRYRAMISVGPNFAYDLCAKRVQPGEKETLDLTCWTRAIVGAEPINPRTLDDFSRTFKSCGFSRNAFVPGYGLAEATLVVTGNFNENISPPPTSSDVAWVDTKMLERGEVMHRSVGAEGARPIVSCGRRLKGLDVVIADSLTCRRQKENRVGEIWVRGDSVARGYWNGTRRADTPFGACLEDETEGGYLRTGDLGFFHGDQLYVTGRLKDLIILRGRNIYPQDMERSAEDAHHALRKGCGACFSIPGPEGERVILVQEVKASEKNNTLRPVAAAIKQRVFREHGVALHGVCLVLPHTIPKTSSGKIQRKACKEGFMKGTLRVLARWEGKNWDLPEGGSEPRQNLYPTEEILARIFQELLETDLRDIEKSTDFFLIGGNSLNAVSLVARIHQALKVKLPLAVLFSRSTLGELAAYIDTREKDAYTAMEKNAPKEEETVTRDQARLLVLDTLKQIGLTYHVPVALAVDGPFDESRFRDAAKALVLRHDMLRSSFHLRENDYVRRVHDHVTVDIAGYQGDEASFAEQFRNFVRPFDLENPPLFRIGWMRITETRHLIFMDVHHAVCDGMSLALLFRELLDGYARKTLPPVHRTFRDYAAYLEMVAASPAYRTHEAF